ncbi:long-chain-fatty-acid--CoA ligase [Desulfotruncus alcoholivorax]|uniref:long-chain-fatty-acid--CoA ligase n=1 Tax=Desulfotruncus alcoholivorax TaxID=265477 RepID=UPI0004244E3E|nr:long-chain fatty acid--CoA ligase [Desulfotruncus alcoholivorax]
MLVCDFILRSLEQYPDKTAVIFQDDELSYKDLAEKIGRLAAGLKDLDIKQGEYVALLLPNHLEFTTSYFALNFIGAPVVPINPMLKGPEIQYILQDCKAVAIITIAPFAPLIDSIKRSLPHLRKVIIIGEQSTPEQVNYSSLFAYDADLSRPSVDVEDISACLFTSGTTGKPKGVMLTHKNLVFDTEMVTKAIGVDHKERYLGVLPFYHAFAGTVCILAPACTGASVVILDRFMPKSTVECIKKHKVTIFPAVPAIYAAILQAAKNTDPNDFASLRMFVSGGAAMPLEMMRTLEDRYGIVVLEGNGPTETSPISYVNRLELRKHGSVGPPLPGVQVKIVDENDNELPVTAVGEIVVKGDNVMKGYLNRPDDTAACMRGGWFHTGDLGMVDEDGYVYIVDRKKDLIIVGGFNVYPREVEEVLYQHPAVMEAAVVGIPDQMRGEVPKAFIVLKAGAEATPKELINFCREKLADFKCPRQIEFREELPKGANGKILKRVLKMELQNI